ncbi:ester cyclase [uncultured Litoreibacter sp.]|uniref:ester cyclase n=1 Tax=uncultured Litoreibacter sp. TaxID=1392394 RepID=UPI002604B9F5|nr:ester cyclase [uncultured Litoreibacter sp.]
MSLSAYRAALYDFAPDTVRSALKNAFAPDALIQLAHPFETLSGPLALFEEALGPLQQAWPDLERRETIVIEGDAKHGHWVGCCGYYTGTFAKPLLGIPATGHQVAMRFHEFFRIENGLVVEMQALWDLPEVMMQAGVWPMSPSLGREWHVPGPATQDGFGPHGNGTAAASVVENMLIGLGMHKEGGVEAMNLPRYWHPKCSWYGPSGIGTCRGIAGFRNWHQIPFLKAMPNRVGDPAGGHLFAQGDYVGFTAWPGMQATISGDGWLGIAPSGHDITLRSLDFWRVENGLIRENWVLVDLLHVYAQIGVEVLARMRELVNARTGRLDP